MFTAKLFLLSNGHYHLGESTNQKPHKFICPDSSPSRKSFTFWQQKVIFMKDLEPLFQRLSVAKFHKPPLHCSCCTEVVLNWNILFPRGKATSSMHNKLEIFTAHPVLPKGKLTYFPAGNEINLTFIYCNNSFVVKRLLKYLISQIIIHGIKLCIVRKTTHIHIAVHTYTLYVLPVTQIRGR